MCIRVNLAASHLCDTIITTGNISRLKYINDSNDGADDRKLR
jgi:hypothetical protein